MNSDESSQKPRRPRSYGSRRDRGRGGIDRGDTGTFPVNDGSRPYDTGTDTFTSFKNVSDWRLDRREAASAKTTADSVRSVRGTNQPERSSGKNEQLVSSRDRKPAVSERKPVVTERKPVISERKSVMGERKVSEFDYSTLPTKTETTAGGKTSDTGELRRLQRRRDQLRSEKLEERPKPRKKRGRTFLILILVLALLGAAGYAAVSYIPFFNSAADYPGPGDSEVQVVVKEGATGTDIGKELFSKNVVASVAAFANAYTANKAATRIQPGTYKLKLKMKAADAVAALLDRASNIDMQVTVPEGFTKEQIIKRVTTVGNFPEAKVRQAISSANDIGLPAQANGNAEGWMAPGLYSIKPGDGPEVVLKEMVTRNTKRLTVLNVPKDQQMAVLTKASIVEHEVSQHQYFPKVARVIENRLRNINGETQGRLDMDSTVNYGVGKTGGIPTQADKASDNPYNTYKVKGLPPSPIGAVGDDAIKAVMHPVEGKWLYFVAVNLDTGETLFAETLAQQVANTEKLKTWCSANAGKC